MNVKLNVTICVDGFLIFWTDAAFMICVLWFLI